MPSPDFIETYEGALPPDACAALIARFEASGIATPGHTGGGVEPEVKRSRDINVTALPDWRDVDAMLNGAMLNGLLAYLRKYPYVLLSTLSFQHVDADNGQSRRMRADDLLGLDDAALRQLIGAALRPGPINLQHYCAGSGGYPAWHCEQAPNDARAEQLHRTLLWSIYLNEGFSDGETEFMYQERKIVPRTGMLLIAPTAFTHTHRGNVPGGRDKYIATSWVLFKRFDALFGKPQ